MPIIDKNKAVIDFLMTCPYLADNPMFFNFVQAKDNNKQIVTITNDVATQKPYIDGSVMKRYSFSLIDYKSISYNPLVNLSGGLTDENVEDMLDVQNILDWVMEQANIRNFPDFGEINFIDDMRATSENPMFNGADVSVQPALAKYSITIQIDYIDNSKVICK